LIYGEYEADAGLPLYQAAREPKALWIVPGAGHGEYEQAAPEEYRTRVITFLNSIFAPNQ
jgi:fermentation-respiration switch protein FrsA (DUF1100 family)